MNASLKRKLASLERDSPSNFVEFMNILYELISQENVQSVSASMIKPVRNFLTKTRLHQQAGMHPANHSKYELNTVLCHCYREVNALQFCAQRGLTGLLNVLLDEFYMNNFNLPNQKHCIFYAISSYQYSLANQILSRDIQHIARNSQQFLDLVLVLLNNYRRNSSDHQKTQIAPMILKCLDNKKLPSLEKSVISEIIDQCAEEMLSRDDKNYQHKGTLSEIIFKLEQLDPPAEQELFKAASARVRHFR